MTNILSKKAGTHHENRMKMCLICFKVDSRTNRNKFLKIICHGKIEMMINLLFKYNASNEHLPNAICGRCLRNLYRAKDGTSMKVPDLSEFKPIQNTRSATLLPCTCKICIILGKPWKPTDGVRSRTRPGVVKLQKLCSRCLSMIGRGKSHKCNDSSRFNNIKSVMISSSTTVTGIMPHSSLYPCTWCRANKNQLSEAAEPRTIGNTLMNNNNWQAAGAKKPAAKKFFNCIEAPMFTGDSNKLILDVIPPPELHLMLGVVNTVYDHMLLQFEKKTIAWAKACHVERDITCGGTNFNGNSCKKLLDKLDILRATCPIGCMKFIRVLDDFRKVVKACFGKYLDSNFTKFIAEFKKSFLDLEVSVTPKIHAIFYHVAEFCTTHKRSLGFYSEQAMEAVHCDFKTSWNKYKLHHNHPQYSIHLLTAVRQYNALHI